MGGGIAWTNVEFDDEDEPNIFIDNTSRYGANVSSFPFDLIITLSGNNDEVLNDGRLLNSDEDSIEEELELELEIVSGIAFSLEV